MKRWAATFVVMTVFALVSACGQKGALYLPKRGTVVTRPAGAAASPAAPVAPAPNKPADKKNEQNPQQQQNPPQPQ